MKNLKKALVALSPVFLAACASGPVIRGVDQNFDQNTCAVYETETFRKMDGKGEDAAVVEKWSGDKKVIYLDEFCQKKSLLQTQINERFRVKKEAIRGLSNIVSIELKDPTMPAAQKAELLKGYVRDLDSGAQDIIDIRRASLDAQGIDDRELLTIYISGLLEQVEQDNNSSRASAIKELIAINKQTSFWRNPELSTMAKEVLDVDLKDSGMGYAIYLGSLERDCDKTYNAQGYVTGMNCSRN